MTERAEVVVDGELQLDVAPGGTFAVQYPSSTGPDDYDVGGTHELLVRQIPFDFTVAFDPAFIVVTNDSASIWNAKDSFFLGLDANFAEIGERSSASVYVAKIPVGLSTTSHRLDDILQEITATALGAPGAASLVTSIGSGLVSGAITNAQLVGIIDTATGSTAWRTGTGGGGGGNLTDIAGDVGPSISGPDLIAIIDAATGGTGWRTAGGGGGTLTAAQIETLLDARFGNADWRDNTNIALAQLGPDVTAYGTNNVEAADFTLANADFSEQKIWTGGTNCTVPFLTPGRSYSIKRAAATAGTLIAQPVGATPTNFDKKNVQQASFVLPAGETVTLTMRAGSAPLAPVIDWFGP